MIRLVSDSESKPTTAPSPTKGRAKRIFHILAETRERMSLDDVKARAGEIFPGDVTLTTDKIYETLGWMDRVGYAQCEIAGNRYRWSVAPLSYFEAKQKRLVERRYERIQKRNTPPHEPPPISYESVVPPASGPETGASPVIIATMLGSFIATLGIGVALGYLLWGVQ